jgi:hypothetical protein
MLGTQLRYSDGLLFSVQFVDSFSTFPPAATVWRTVHRARPAAATPLASLFNAEG